MCNKPATSSASKCSTIYLLFSLFQIIQGSAAQYNKSLEGTHGEFTEGYRSHVSMTKERTTTHMGCAQIKSKLPFLLKICPCPIPVLDTLWWNWYWSSLWVCWHKSLYLKNGGVHLELHMNRLITMISGRTFGKDRIGSFHISNQWISTGMRFSISFLAMWSPWRWRPYTRSQRAAEGRAIQCHKSLHFSDPCLLTLFL